MSETAKMLHVNLAPGEAGRYAIVPGDPDRCELIAAHLDNPRMVTRKREFTTWEGTLDGERVTVTSTGIGGPSTAICVEELHKCGADTFIRVGTCASTCADVQCGDIVVVSGSVRMDGTSLHYLPMEFPAVPSYQLLKALEESSVSLGFHTTVGVSITKDSFYTQAEPETKPVSDDLIRRWQSYVRGGAVCTSMEESILFSVGSSLGIRTASILVSATNFDGSVSKRNSADVYPTDSIQNAHPLRPSKPCAGSSGRTRADLPPDIKTAPCRRHGAVLFITSLRRTPGGIPPALPRPGHPGREGRPGPPCGGSAHGTGWCIARPPMFPGPSPPALQGRQRSRSTG